MPPHVMYQCSRWPPVAYHTPHEQAVAALPRNGIDAVPFVNDATTALGAGKGGRSEGLGGERPDRVWWWVGGWEVARAVASNSRQRRRGNQR